MDDKTYKLTNTKPIYTISNFTNQNNSYFLPVLGIAILGGVLGVLAIGKMLNK